MKQRKTFTHNGKKYICATHQKVSDAYYDKAVHIHFQGSVLLGWNAKNNTPMPEIIEQAKKTIDTPKSFLVTSNQL